MRRKKNVLNAAAVCHKGNIREKNEDNLFFDEKVLKESHEGLTIPLCLEKVSTKNPQLFGVFDGMGGHAKGERASYLTAKQAGESFIGKGLREKLIPVFLENICLKANEKVCAEMREEKTRIGTTASMLYFFEKGVWICNIGDSPIFRLRNNELEPIFEEHTERILRESILGKEKDQKKKYPLTQHIGIFPSEMMISPFLSSMDVSEGDIFLICSDGLTDMVDEFEITELLQTNQSIWDKVDNLLKAALENGGKDNTTIIGIEIL